MGEIRIEYNKGDLYKMLICSEGHYITDWTEESPIEYFYASKRLMIPVEMSTSDFYCISEDKYNELIELKDGE